MPTKGLSPSRKTTPFPSAAFAVRALFNTLVATAVMVAANGPFYLPATAVADTEVDCKKAFTTRQVNVCAERSLERAQKEMTLYLDASLEHNAHDPQLIAAIKHAQKTWQTYRAAHCDAVYIQWREGSVRTAKTLHCSLELTQQRTHDLWQSFLTYSDSTPPVLPAPSRSLSIPPAGKEYEPKTF